VTLISTGAGELPVKKVIHAVGPIWHGGVEGEELLLRQCVWKSLKKTEELGFASIAIPAISSGIFR
jgi:O-acetyl-ADP-ribose deacetylase (regulator of RNase III)